MEPFVSSNKKSPAEGKIWASSSLCLFIRKELGKRRRGKSNSKARNDSIINIFGFSGLALDFREMGALKINVHAAISVCTWHWAATKLLSVRKLIKSIAAQSVSRTNEVLSRILGSIYLLFFQFFDEQQSRIEGLFAHALLLIKN